MLKRALFIERDHPGDGCPLLAVADALHAELAAEQRGERTANEPFGWTPLVRFLGAYLKRVHVSGCLVAVGDADTMFTAFAGTITQYLPSPRELKLKQRAGEAMRCARLLGGDDFGMTLQDYQDLLALAPDGDSTDSEGSAEAT